MTELRIKRRQRLIRVAQEVFVAHGFRGATMERIASQANVSKATLYSYFPDKPAVFEAVALAVSERLVALVTSKLAETPDPGSAVIGALIAKHMHIQSLVRSSGFAADLFATNAAISKHHFQQADHDITARLAERLDETRKDGAELAQTLMAASLGIANASTTETELRSRLTRLAALVEGPET